MTEKQRRFVEAYMGTAAGNATEAARIAGYAGSDNTLKSVGAENLAKPDIAAAIDARQKADPLIADRNERQRFLTEVMRGVQTFTPKGGETAPLPVKMADRLKACEMLGRGAGDYGPKGTEDDPLHNVTRVIGWPEKGSAAAGSDAAA